MGKKKGQPYYGVAKGRKTGVFLSWDECEDQVKGFRDGKYKRFDTREEAEDFVGLYGGGGSSSEPPEVPKSPEEWPPLPAECLQQDRSAAASLVAASSIKYGRISAFSSRRSAASSFSLGRPAASLVKPRRTAAFSSGRSAAFSSRPTTVFSSGRPAESITPCQNSASSFSTGRPAASVAPSPRIRQPLSNVYGNQTEFAQRFSTYISKRTATTTTTIDTGPSPNKIRQTDEEQKEAADF